MDDLDAIRMEARDNFERSSQEVQHLTRQFFKSMDTNDDNLVDFQEIDTFFQDGNFLIQPYGRCYDLITSLDNDRDCALNFDEFITFFYVVFLRAKCDGCDKWLMGKKRRTCVDCIRSATVHNGVISTYDLCRTCYHITHRYSHHHARSQLLKFDEVIFNGNVPPPRPDVSYGTLEPRQELFKKVFLALQAAANTATICTACNIM
ncbi:hypothetical protein QQ045_026231 [Rhodiola kirilowii]